MTWLLVILYLLGAVVMRRLFLEAVSGGVLQYQTAGHRLGYAIGIIFWPLVVLAGIVANLIEWMRP